MKKDGIQTRKRKPKSHTSMGGNLPGPSGIHKTDIKPNLLGESPVSKSIIQFILSPNITPINEHHFSFWLNEYTRFMFPFFFLRRFLLLAVTVSMPETEDVIHVDCH